MGHKQMGVLLACTLLAVSGCSKKPAQRVSVDMASASKSAQVHALRSLAISEAYAATPQRFVAVRHKLEVIAPESTLPKTWQAVMDFCGTIQCEVVSSSITTKTRYLPPSGTMALRIAPDDVKKLFAFVEKQGTTAQHSTETEDKTSDVIDTEAKIKNLTSFRDNLRGMLAKPSTTVKDSVEIQQQLTDVQSQLDSELIQRKVLANETEKTAVEISFRVELVGGEPRGWAQIWAAFRESGDVLADSVYWLIVVIIAVLPWTLVLAPIACLVVRLWRRWRRKKVTSAPV